ncbi:MAG: hypothetical protein WKG07_43445 [Hymenobacter sp.]
MRPGTYKNRLRGLLLRVALRCRPQVQSAADAEAAARARNHCAAARAARRVDEHPPTAGAGAARISGYQASPHGFSPPPRRLAHHQANPHFGARPHAASPAAA